MSIPTRIGRWWLAPFVAAAAAVAWLGFGAPEGPLGFRCPMHPAVVLERKGSCPICGMELIERPLELAARGGDAARGGARDRAAAGPARYTCPMHPGFVADDPSVRCPECGMVLVAKSPDRAPPPAPSAPR